MNKNLKYLKPYLIAEIGINHNGSMIIAKKMMDVAKAYGFDAVKFQKRDPDFCIPKNKKKNFKRNPLGNDDLFSI